jgi:hypothetical protein
MTGKQETAIVHAVIDAIKNRYKASGDAWHVSGSSKQSKGQPDIDGYLPLEIVGEVPTAYTHLKLEVKTPEGELSPLQEHRLKAFARAGYTVAVITSVKDLDRLVHLLRCLWFGDNAEEWIK